MTDELTELEWPALPVTPPNPAAPAPRRCSRHLWDAGVCARCDHTKDDAKSRRGKNNRTRGNAIEREVGKALGLKRVGQFGGATDLGEAADPFAVQVKSGGMFSERYWNELRRLPVAAGQTALLVVTDAPGPGHKRRSMVVLELADWIDLHGPLEG